MSISVHIVAQQSAGGGSPRNTSIVPTVALKAAIYGFLKSEAGGLGVADGVFNSNPMPLVAGSLTGIVNGCAAVFAQTADISTGSKTATITWDAGGAALGWLAGIAADNDLSVVSATPYDSVASVSVLGGAIATQPGDMLLGFVRHVGSSTGNVAGETHNSVFVYSGYNRVIAKPAGAGSTTDFIYASSSMTNAKMSVIVLRETVAAISATHGDQDVAFGQDPSFAGNVNGANLLAGAISIPLALGAGSTNSAPTFDLIDFTALLRDTSFVPFAGTQLQIEITSDDGGDTPVTRDINLDLPADFALQTLTSVVNTAGSIAYQSAGYDGPDFTPEDDAQIAYDDRFNTSIAADGALTTDRNGTEIQAWIFEPSSGKLFFYPVAAPATESITVNGSPATLEPSTQYTATVVGSTSVCDGGETFNTGTGYAVTIDSADIGTITFTTSASLPAGSPVEFKFNFPSA